MAGMELNYTIIGIGVAGFSVLLLFRRWLWYIVLPPGIAIALYAILNTIHHRH